MCLAIPAFIKSIDGMEAEAEIGGISRHISIQLTPEASVGDYVLVGQDRKGEYCRHIFDIGGEYFASIVQYGTAEFDAAAALQVLGLATADSSAADP